MDQQTCGACMKLLPDTAFATTGGGLRLSSTCRICTSARTALGRHGLTAADKAEIAQAQDGCAICGCLSPGKKGWVVDHDRSCCPAEKSCADCRRAVLCQWCNNALGYAVDSPVVLRRMADYLELQTRLGHDPLDRQSTDRSTDSVERSAQPNATNVTDETDGEVTNPPLKSIPPLRAGAHTDFDVAPTAGRRRFAPAANIGGTA